MAGFREKKSRIGGSRGKRKSFHMCDYSLHLIASRPAKVADKLVSVDFVKSITRGFAEIGQSEVAVCLLPGTEIAFDNDVQYDRAFSMFGRARIEQRVARFRQVNMDDPHVHHDALEFPNHGQIVKDYAAYSRSNRDRAAITGKPIRTRRRHGGRKPRKKPRKSTRKKASGNAANLSPNGGRRNLARSGGPWGGGA